MFGTALTLLSFALAALCASSPPSGAITVGPGGKYSTLTAALADTSSSVYFIYGTSIKERVVITRSVTIYGQTSNALTYSNNQVTITNNIPASTAGSNEASATISVKAADVKLYNLNIANTYGQGSQAIALSGLEFFGKSYINGATDFIFGQRASLWFTGGTIETIGNGWITASGRSSEDANYYVIDKCTITGTGTQYLGKSALFRRPWRNYARVIFQNSNIGSQVQAAGWTQWSTATPNTDHILFGEYNNSGAGAWKSGRASFATKLTAGLSMSTVFGGSTSWVDSAYL
ncbi:pectinesterase [Ceratobasidium sp. AG-Ba]|nr:pectinesterase [Ceratobasidium sp. AG-Ba]